MCCDCNVTILPYCLPIIAGRTAKERNTGQERISSLYICIIDQIMHLPIQCSWMYFLHAVHVCCGLLIISKLDGWYPNGNLMYCNVMSLCLIHSWCTDVDPIHLEQTILWSKQSGKLETRSRYLTWPFARIKMFLTFKLKLCGFR